MRVLQATRLPQMCGASESLCANCSQGKCFFLVNEAFRNLPFEDRSDPLQIHQAIISGEIRYSGIDATARDLLT